MCKKKLLFLFSRCLARGSIHQGFDPERFSDESRRKPERFLCVWLCIVENEVACEAQTYFRSSLLSIRRNMRRLASFDEQMLDCDVIYLA